MKFILSNCFCYIKLEKGFPYILYLDIVRLIWLMVILIFHFIEPSSNYIDYIFDGLDLLSLIYQAIRSIISLNSGYNRLEFKIHVHYFISKIFFVLLNFNKLFLKPQIKCENEVSYRFCFNNYLNDAYWVDLIWTIFEVYFIIVVYSFCVRAYRGEYREPIIHSHLIIYKKAIILEVKGIRIKKAVINAERGTILYIKNERKAKIHPKQKNNFLYSIFK